MRMVAARPMPQMKIGNCFASITTMNFERESYPMYALDDPFSRIESFGPTRVTFSGIAQYSPEVLKAVEKWMYGIPQFPHYESEFLCLHCGSPQPITQTHCKQCGAPRSFLLG